MYGHTESASLRGNHENGISYDVPVKVYLKENWECCTTIAEEKLSLPSASVMMIRMLNKGLQKRIFDLW
jgi:hypothetical protein